MLRVVSIPSWDKWDDVWSHALTISSREVFWTNLKGKDYRLSTSSTSEAHDAEASTSIAPSPLPQHQCVIDFHCSTNSHFSSKVNSNSSFTFSLANSSLAHSLHFFRPDCELCKVWGVASDCEIWLGHVFTHSTMIDCTVRGLSFRRGTRVLSFSSTKTRPLSCSGPFSRASSRVSSRHSCTSSRAYQKLLLRL